MEGSACGAGGSALQLLGLLQQGVPLLQLLQTLPGPPLNGVPEAPPREQQARGSSGGGRQQRQLHGTGPGDSPPRQPSPGGSDAAASRKVAVTCSDVHGVLHLEHLYVACYCADCEARVQGGHDRPIFGLRWATEGTGTLHVMPLLPWLSSAPVPATPAAAARSPCTHARVSCHSVQLRCSRFERHCGSKAKKWRTSLRVEPGEAGGTVLAAALHMPGGAGSCLMRSIFTCSSMLCMRRRCCLPHLTQRLPGC